MRSPPSKLHSFSPKFINLRCMRNQILRRTIIMAEWVLIFLNQLSIFIRTSNLCANPERLLLILSTFQFYILFFHNNLFLLKFYTFLDTLLIQRKSFSSPYTLSVFICFLFLNVTQLLFTLVVNFNLLRELGSQGEIIFRYTDV